LYLDKVILERKEGWIMSAPRIVLLLPALLILVPIGLHAQQEPPVAPGDRVRVTAPSVSARPVVGQLLAMHSDSLSIEAEKWRPGGHRQQVVNVPVGSLTQLEVSRGRTSKAGTGALVGFVVTGLAVGAFAQAFCTNFTLFESDPDDAGECLPRSLLAGGAGGLFIGVPLGLLIGSRSKGDRWEEVPLNMLRIGPSPVTTDGVALSVSLSLAR
jgi:hypothetical protein